ncbi:hypothetical protein DYB32_009665 [Aphanomyces invadans]|uniref:DDE-1 domain-containing protein n=1 Tax=Aphanomyces invadans TaxID=157072 RepID=A0A418AI29_9STRA|nr:hypothetical protein DYB32_009665 [Aphanomyces invadans]
MAPCRTWAEVGEVSRDNSTEKHSNRLTAVMAACADGMACFLRGVIQSEEFPTLPSCHLYVQQNASMDDAVWEFYLKELLKFDLIGHTVLLVDNLATHVWSSPYKLVDEELIGFLEPLPPNSTSACQPLDVGIMDH